MTAERTREYNRVYYAAHREQIKAGLTKWRKANRARCSARSKAWYRANRERTKQIQDRYRNGNMERLAETQSVIREHRQKAGYSQQALATEIGVSVSTISNWELGKSPAKWEKLMQALPTLQFEKRMERENEHHHENDEDNHMD